jgi:hypothetical protein
MRKGERGNVFGKMQLNLARHNLEVTLKRHKEGCFEAAKKMALESADGARKVDGFVRKHYCDEPRKMAEWEKIMAKYEFLEDEIEDEAMSDKL